MVGLITQPIPPNRRLKALGRQAQQETLGARLAAEWDETLVRNPAASLWRWAGRQIDPGRVISAEEANQRFGIGGRLSFDGPIGEDAAQDLFDLRKAELERQDIIGRAPQGFWAGAASLAVGFAGSAIDPLNVGLSFVPVVGQARYALWLARAGSPMARAGVRLGVGALEGLAGAALLEPLVYGVARDEQADYGLMDSMLNLGFGTALGGGLHLGVGTVGDVLARARGEPPGWAQLAAGETVRRELENADLDPRLAAALSERTRDRSELELALSETPVQTRESLLRAAVEAVANERVPVFPTIRGDAGGTLSPVTRAAAAAPAAPDPRRADARASLDSRLARGDFLAVRERANDLDRQIEAATAERDAARAALWQVKDPGDGRMGIEAVGAETSYGGMAENIANSVEFWRLEVEKPGLTKTARTKAKKQLKAAEQELAALEQKRHAVAQPIFERQVAGGNAAVTDAQQKLTRLERQRAALEPELARAATTMLAAEDRQAVPTGPDPVEAAMEALTKAAETAAKAPAPTPKPMTVPAPVMTAAARVAEDVERQLRAAGRPADVAAAEALIWRAWAETMGARLGRDPWEVYRQIGLRLAAEEPVMGAGYDQYAGAQADTADLRGLKRAMRLDDGGVDAEQIRAQTGWFRGLDGDWRFEIDDSQMRVLVGPGEHAGRLDEIIEHDALFQAYPGLRDIKADVRIGTDTDRGGRFNPAARRITVQAKDAEEAASLIAHEIQHAIQRIEGFAIGGNPGSPRLDPYVRQMREEYGLDPSAPITDGERRSVYRRLAGELEAYDVQARVRMTPEERAATPPYDSQVDTMARYGDPIVRFQQGGVPTASWTKARSLGYRMELGEVNKSAKTLSATIIAPDGTRTTVAILWLLPRVGKDMRAPAEENAWFAYFNSGPAAPAAPAAAQQPTPQRNPSDEGDAPDPEATLSAPARKALKDGDELELFSDLQYYGAAVTRKDLEARIDMAQTALKIIKERAPTVVEMDKWIENNLIFEYDEPKALIKDIKRALTDDREKLDALAALEQHWSEIRTADPQLPPWSDNPWDPQRRADAERLRLQEERAYAEYLAAGGMPASPAAIADWRRKFPGAPRTMFVFIPETGAWRAAPLGVVRYEQTARGQVEFRAAETLVRLGQAADRSTFMHESAHIFLRQWEILADQDVLPAEMRGDWQTIRDWLGAEEGAALSRDQHERFARGFEAYLAEGRAPSEQLASVFAQFRDWLLAIYRSLAGLDVQLTPEIRGVFDRMLAAKAADDIEAGARAAAPTNLPEKVNTAAPAMTEVTLADMDIAQALADGLIARDDPELTAIAAEEAQFDTLARGLDAAGACMRRAA